MINDKLNSRRSFIKASSHLGASALFVKSLLVFAESVVEMLKKLFAKMKATNHPFILGSECDVLSISGYEKTILNKINIMLNCCKH